jgi:hypothetical protein
MSGNSTGLVEVQEGILPCVEPRSRIDRLSAHRGERAPICHPLAGQLGLVYVSQGPPRRTIRQGDIRQWGIAEPLLRLLAQENLARHEAIHQARIIGDQGGPQLLFHHPELPVAAAVDNDAFRRSLRALVGEAPLIALPRRNVLLAIGASNTAGMAAFLAQAETLYRSSAHPLSDAVIRMDGGNLQVAGDYWRTPDQISAPRVSAHYA